MNGHSGKENDGNDSRQRKLGPTENRSLTDVLCGVVFLAFLVAWATIFVLAIRWGNPLKLVFPTDSEGRVCGFKNKMYDLRHKPYLYFFDLSACFAVKSLLSGCPTPQVCVDACPSEYFMLDSSSAWLNPSNLSDVVAKSICKPSVEKETITSGRQVFDLVQNNSCAKYYLDSKPVAGRCVPKKFLAGIEGLTQNASKLFAGTPMEKFLHSVQAQGVVKTLFEAQGALEDFVADIGKAWWQIFLGLVLAAVLAFLWLYAMQVVAKIMVWLSLLLAFAILISTTAYSWITFGKLNSLHKGPSHYVETNMFDEPKTWFSLGIALSIVTFTFTLVIWFLLERIRLAIALIHESSKAVSCVLSSLFFPIVPFLLQLAVGTFWATVAVMIASAGKPYCQTTSTWSNLTDTDRRLWNVGQKCSCMGAEQVAAPNPNLPTDCQFLRYVPIKGALYFQMFNLFGLVWGLAFVSGFAQVVLAGAFASYYWTMDKAKDLPTMPVWTCLIRTAKYNLGSIALGSLLLAIVEYIRIVLEYFEAKLKKLYDSGVLRWIMIAVKCLLYLIERVIKLINKNAYILMAIYGRHFCASAHMAVGLLARNFVRVIVLTRVTDFLIVVGKAVVTFVTALIAYFYFMGTSGASSLGGRLNYPFLPVLIITIGSYLICSCFFNVYDMAVDTTFICFLEDDEKNDGSAEKPYYMSDELKEILHKKNVDEPKQPVKAEAV